MGLIMVFVVVVLCHEVLCRGGLMSRGLVSLWSYVIRSCVVVVLYHEVLCVVVGLMSEDLESF